VVVHEPLAGVVPQRGALVDRDLSTGGVFGQRPAQITDRRGLVDLDAAVEARRTTIVSDP
jgi:hypothetical protein